MQDRRVSGASCLRIKVGAERTTAKKRRQSPRRAATPAPATEGEKGRGKDDIGSCCSGTGVTLLLLCGVYGALAGRRYIAIPVDGFDVIELSPVPPATARITRQTEAYLPVAVPSVSQEEPRSVRSERSNARILDYVDFGGQTGSNGAFSWYADYPAHH
ncbi:uncharacterized protein LOC117210274 isoform X1 [Bombus bifarius]|uniref:Uncharacterized protein LOC117210274 isoform X1 n=1 Tax=Bombus bifarius TaxID=103933 RepID=A0A6P8MHY9_9HYME|nr:uncharacterized protein LOC117210274 isoform X1 [Bombus bifarius]